MTQQEFLKEFNRREFYYQEFNMEMYALLLESMQLYPDVISPEDKSDFLREYANVSICAFERIGETHFYHEIKSYAEQLSNCMHFLLCEKMNAFLDELEEEHFINKSILLSRFLFNPKYKDVRMMDKNITNEEKLFTIANKYYEPDGLYDEAHKVYCALEDYKSARRVRYSQATSLFYKDEFEKANYYFRCALDYDDAQEYVMYTENEPEEHERFIREIPRDYLCKRLRELQPKLYDEYVELFKKNEKKESPRLRKKLSKLYDKLYEYVPTLDDELVERYRDKVGEDIVISWLGDLPVIHVHDK